MMIFSRQNRTKLLIELFSIIAFFAVWHTVAVFMNSPLVLPKPADVFFRLFELIPEKAFQKAVAATLGRTFKAFAVSLAVSVFIGILIGANENFESFFRFPLAVIKSTPVVSFILVALFWFKSAAVPVFVAVLMTLPVLTETISAGIKNTNKKLLDMAMVYHFSFRQKLMFIYAPSVMPYFFSGMLSALGLTWKVVVAGEILSLPKNSVGMALQTAKVHLETTDVFAWTFAVIFLSFACESVFAFYTKKVKNKLKMESQND